MKKVYLKDLTPDEVIRRLKAGEVLKTIDEDTEMKIVEGLLCSFYKDGSFTINGDFHIDKDLDKYYYFEEPEELKLEDGKCYKTRDGHCAICHYIDKKDNMFPYKFVVVGEYVAFSTNEDGRLYKNTEDKLDLISEWSNEDVAED